MSFRPIDYDNTKGFEHNQDVIKAHKQGYDEGFIDGVASVKGKTIIRPVYYKDSNQLYGYFCKQCGNPFTEEEYTDRYRLCPWCGFAVDWSDVE